MALQSTVPPEFLADLTYAKDPLVARLLEMVVALGGEVFLLRAEAERLRRALAERGTVDEAALDAVAADPDFRAWLAREQTEFTRHIFDPIGRGRGILEPGQGG